MTEIDFTNALRKAKKRLIQMHYESKVGHIGGNLSCLDMLLFLYLNKIKSGDDFVLSKGHSAGALYIALWMKGFIPEEELSTFHKDHSRLAGHPTSQALPFVTFSTGSLGHGLSLATGLALAKKIQAKDGLIYCLTSDGEWNEGSTWEALIFAAHHKLDNLVILIDQNGLQGFGTTEEVANLSPLEKKLSCFDVDVSVIDGHHWNDFNSFIHPSPHCPKIIIANTVKGKGMRFMENKMEWHYLALTQELYLAAISDLENLI